MVQFQIAKTTYDLAEAIHEFQTSDNPMKGERFALDLVAALPGGDLFGAMGYLRDQILALEPEDLIKLSNELKKFTNPIDDMVNGAFNRAAAFTRRVDPLTLDLDGDGLETIGIDPNNPIFFDHNADGIKTATGWIKADDGFLVLDRNGNGASGIAELTGSLLLASNTFYSQFTDSIPLTEQAKTLPQMSGSGLVRDLRGASLALAGTGLGANDGEWAKAA